MEDRRLRRQLGRRHAILEREDWRSMVPGCSSRRSLQAHHIVFRSRGGDDAPENLTEFELGTREGRPPVARYRSGDRFA